MMAYLDITFILLPEQNNATYPTILRNNNTMQTLHNHRKNDQMPQNMQRLLNAFPSGVENTYTQVVTKKKNKRQKKGDRKTAGSYPLNIKHGENPHP